MHPHTLPIAAEPAVGPMVVATALVTSPALPVTGGLVDVGGELFYRIENHDAMEPFLMSVASSSDHWLFVASNGALTAGRRTPDEALFPYYNDDGIYESVDRTGGRTVLRVHRGGVTHRWEPFSERYAGMYRLRRTLDKSVTGTTVRFTEINDDLGLAFSQAWATSERYGFVRSCSLTNHSGAPVSVGILDGIQNLLPPGVDHVGQQRFSTIADGYKDNELFDRAGLSMFRLSALPRDTAEPNESLRVTTAWTRGLTPTAQLLSTTQLELFRTGGAPRTERRIRGRRGAHLVTALVVIADGSAREWVVVADTGLDATDVIALSQELAAPDVVERVRADVARSADRLVTVLAAADGLQCTADGLHTARHYSNTLFNAMRGGVPVEGYQIRKGEFAAYLERASSDTTNRHRGWLDDLPAVMPRTELIASAAQQSTGLERLTRAYLPLRHSRRHGDPSRPWNTFKIAPDEPGTGRNATGYEGNWRDIFQNWEALAYSYPGYLDAMISKFLDCSTADGYNPYHVTQDGFGWQALATGESPLHVGYWGDHQVIYLLKLLEAAVGLQPGMLEPLLGRRSFSYANVPYRIKAYSELLADPHQSIEFDFELHRSMQQDRVNRGTDACLLPGPDGEPLLVSMAEKLLLVALTKLVNYVPGEGIWLNTQRPEWNDGNNALVGNGVSVVTLCYLRRYLAFLQKLWGAAAAGAAYPVSVEVVQLLRRVATALRDTTHLLGSRRSDADRASLLDRLGNAGSDYRSTVYKAGLAGVTEQVSGLEILAVCQLALRHVDDAIRANRRSDGLYHAYNVLRFTGSGVAIRHLAPMLEGQVAVLSSGALRPDEAVGVLDALRASPLYRSDQGSYMLYPDRELPGFLDKGRIPPAAIDAVALLRRLLERGHRNIVRSAPDGSAYFSGDLRNARDLATALEQLNDPELGPLLAVESERVLELYEHVFDHLSYTGRSETFFKYEGLGCIYWHMVSKLRLAVQEVLADARDDATRVRLAAHYAAIREGLGVHKSPNRHGAVPIDPYSHTPGFAGAQQPGMTGQVKEDILCRLGELGLVIERGRIRFTRDTLQRSEFVAEPCDFKYVDVQGGRRQIEVGPGALAFTFCQVPIVVHRSGRARIVVTFASAPPQIICGLVLTVEATASMCARSGEVTLLEVFLDDRPSPSG